MEEIRDPAARLGVIPAESRVKTAGYWDCSFGGVTACKTDPSDSL